MRSIGESRRARSRSPCWAPRARADAAPTATATATSALWRNEGQRAPCCDPLHALAQQLFAICFSIIDATLTAQDGRWLRLRGQQLRGGPSMGGLPFDSRMGRRIGLALGLCAVLPVLVFAVLAARDAWLLLTLTLMLALTGAALASAYLGRRYGPALR